MEKDQELQVGDPVSVNCPGLAMLRNACPAMPPNHHGQVSEIDGDSITVEFMDGDGSYQNSQVAPYDRSQVARR